MLKNIVLFFMSSLLFLGCQDSGSYIRTKVVKLSSSKGGSCTGEQVHTASGNDYILTAAHCEGLTENGSILASLDNMPAIPRRVIQVSEKTDLMLLEGMPNLRGLDVSKKELKPHDWLRAYTHGKGYPTYLSSGEFLEIKQTPIFLTILSDQTEEDFCKSKPKYKVEEIGFLFFKVKACFLNINDEVTTVRVAPGSSGGPVVDTEGNLAGVVSGGSDDGFSFLVTLPDIREFLKGY